MRGVLKCVFVGVYISTLIYAAICYLLDSIFLFHPNQSSCSLSLSIVETLHIDLFIIRQGCIIEQRVNI